MEDTKLDIVSGFKISDGEIHLYVLEGLRNGAMKHMVCEILQEELPPGWPLELLTSFPKYHLH